MTLLQLVSRLGVRRLTSTGSRSLIALDGGRGLATGPAAPRQDGPNQSGGGLAKLAAEADQVDTFFKEYQRKYFTFMNELKEIDVPISGEDKAVRKYAFQVESLKLKVGLPNGFGLLRAKMNYMFQCAHYDMKKYLHSALEDPELNLVAHRDAVQELLKVVEEVEQQTGAPWDRNNKKAWEIGKPKLEALKQKYIPEGEKTLAEDLVKAYKEQIMEMRREALQELEAVKKRDGLEDLQVDINKLQPRFAA